MTTLRTKVIYLNQIVSNSNLGTENLVHPTAAYKKVYNQTIIRMTIILTNILKNR